MPKPHWHERKHAMPRAEAEKLIEAHQLGRIGSEQEPFGHAFPWEAIEEMKKANPGSRGIRFYHAIDPEGLQTLVALAIDEEGKDTGTVAMDYNWPCPPYCQPTWPD